MKKRAISDIVSTVLIIMIAVAAVGLIGAIVIPMVRDNLGTGSACNLAINDLYIDGSSGFSCIDLGKGILPVQIVRSNLEIEYAGAKVSVLSGGNSYMFEISSNFPNNKETFYLNISGLESIDLVEVYPLVLVGQNFRQCDRSSSLKLDSCELRQEIVAVAIPQLISQGSSGFLGGSSNPSNGDNGGGDAGVELFECNQQNAQGFYNGSGNVTEPYGICNVTMLQNIDSNLGSNYVLLSHIDALGFDFKPIGYVAGQDYKVFGGSFDGKGYTIFNLSINTSHSVTNSYIGLFAYVAGNISNVGLLDVEVTGDKNSHVGGLVGYSTGTISNSYSAGMVSTNSNVAGGLVGYSTGTISNSYSTVSVTGNNNLGGLVGYSTGTISNSYSGGIISGVNGVGGLVGTLAGIILESYSTGNVTGNEYVGGLVGVSNSGSNISKSYSTGNVTGASYVGGLVGHQRPNTVISESYNLGSIIGTSSTIGWVGGIVGYIEGGIIKNTYSRGDIKGYSRIGGLVGAQWGGNISKSYSTGNVTGLSYVGGLVGSSNPGFIEFSYYDSVTSGRSDNDGRGIPKTTEEMMNTNRPDIYEDWNFSTIWIQDSAMYPELRYFA